MLLRTSSATWQSLLRRPFNSCRPLVGGARSFSEILVTEHADENLPPNAVVSILTLNRPKANAMGRQMVAELQEQLQLLKERNTRCLIVTSCSDRVFSAGADLKERRTMTPDEAQAFVSQLRQTMQQIAD